MHYRETLIVRSRHIGRHILWLAEVLSKGGVASFMLLVVAGCDGGEAPPSRQVTQAPAAKSAPSQESMSAPPPQSPDAEQADRFRELRQRAAARWDALVARDFELAYTFETPSYRKVYDVARYKARFGSRVGWLGARVTRIEYPGDKVAEVMVAVHYRAAIPIQGADIVQADANLKEKWLKEEGTWFHVTE